MIAYFVIWETEGAVEAYSTREAAEDAFDPEREEAHVLESEVSEELWLWLRAIDETEAGDCRLDDARE